MSKSTGKTKEQAAEDEKKVYNESVKRSADDQRKIEEDIKQKEEELAAKAAEEAEKIKQLEDEKEKQAKLAAIEKQREEEQKGTAMVTALVRQVPNSGFLSLNGNVLHLPKKVGDTVKVPMSFVKAFPQFLAGSR